MYHALNGVRPEAVLNDHGGCLPGDEPLDHALRRTMNQLKAEAIDAEGRQVDYNRLKTSPTFATYRELVACLQAFDLARLTTHEAQMAFWLNLYNALIIHAVIAYGPSRSITDQRGVFDLAAYHVNGYRFSANDIEHGILRCNRSHPLVPGPVFAAHDLRRMFMLMRFDPRLHAALNCAARSCPPINFYTPDRLNVQLDVAMRSFVNGGGLQIDRVRHRVSLSRIFSWYASDFGASWFGYRHAERLIRYVMPFIQEADDRAWLEAHMPSLKVRFMPYDWSLNA
jgi:hypothetical protein